MPNRRTLANPGKASQVSGRPQDMVTRGWLIHVDTMKNGGFTTRNDCLTIKMKVSTSNMYKYVSSIIKQLKTGPVQNQRFVWWYFVSGVSIWMCHLKLELDYPCVFVYSGFSTRKRKSQKRRVWPFQFLFGAVEQSWCSEQVYTVWTVYQTDLNRIRHYLRTKRCPAPLAGGLSRPPSQFSEGAPVSARSARTACLLFLQASLSHGQVTRISRISKELRRKNM